MNDSSDQNANLSFFQKANIAFRDRDYVTAIENYEKAIELNPSFASIAQKNLEQARAKLAEQASSESQSGMATGAMEAQVLRDIFSVPAMALQGRLPSEDRPQTANYGRDLQKLVKSFSSRIHSSGGSDEYELVASEFDLEYYLLKYGDVAAARGLDAVQHYLEFGAKEGRDPNPNFSTEHYRYHNPDVQTSGDNPYAHWLERGRSEGRICEPFKQFNAFCEGLELSPQVAQSQLQIYRKSVHDRLKYGTLGKMVEKASLLEPLISQGWTEVPALKLPPFHSDNLVDCALALQRLHELSGHRSAEHVIIVNRARWGSGLKDEGYLARALASDVDTSEILVILSDDEGDVPDNRFMQGCRVVNFFSVAKNLSHEDRLKVFVSYLRSLNPRAAYNINSRLCWEMIQQYGKAVSASIDLYAYFFCNEKDAYGYWTGFPVEYFYRSFDILKGAFVDSHYLKGDFITRFALSETLADRITVLETPVEEEIPTVARSEKEVGKRIYWAGRFDKQKRLDVVFSIAASRPDLEFHLWGRAVLDDSLEELAPPENVVFEGVYSRFTELPLEDCDLWLYTSEWDGVPHLLLEVGMTGIPLVGSVVGGTHEVFIDNLTWGVKDCEDVAAYLAAFDEVLGDPIMARERALQLRTHLLANRSADSYLTTLRGTSVNG